MPNQRLNLTELAESIPGKLAAGEKIGVVGRTGVSYGAHLYFQVDIDGKPVAARTARYFFERLSPFALKTLAGLVALSFVLPYAWCRYLCPYGALLRLASLAAKWPVRVSASSARPRSSGSSRSATTRS